MHTSRKKKDGCFFRRWLMWFIYSFFRSQLSWIRKYRFLMKLVIFPPAVFRMSWHHQWYLVVVVSQCSAQFVVVHVVFVLAEPPQTCDLFSVQQLELSIFTCPGDQVTLPLVLQQVEQELPQRDGGVHGCGGGVPDRHVLQNFTLTKRDKQLLYICCVKNKNKKKNNFSYMCIMCRNNVI